MCRYEQTAVVRAEAILFPNVCIVQDLNPNAEVICHFDRPPCMVVVFQTASTRQQVGEQGEVIMDHSNGMLVSKHSHPSGPHFPLYPHARTDLYPLPTISEAHMHEARCVKVFQ